ncbi:MAG TPA: hypothetical protein PLD20_15065 [Blastocatellia bacterium]|nr:hypothetical protein [Blastocatellia bacterium]HMY73890.1 hypothetical protein [Blastocatellia bacterium]HMZ19254.1 hypothetical protein [Blastocatellia bacterium]HNG33257.1 hypothetical protein [Blastocatellia bacterium]
MKSKSGRIIFLALLLATLATINAAAQTKQPNLTGTWKMNAEKSKFEQGGPSEITIKIEHKDSTLTESLFLVTGGGDRTVEAKYTTDGKESTQEVMGATAQTSAKWEGDVLIIDWKVESAGFNRKITLSADGKTMTMLVKQSTPDGQSATDTVVLEKQDAKK